MSDYDFTDPLIREMVAEHHKPKEIISLTNAGVVQRHQIVCRQCGQTWPCGTRKAFKTWQEEHWAEAHGG